MIVFVAIIYAGFVCSIINIIINNNLIYIRTDNTIIVINVDWILIFITKKRLFTLMEFLLETRTEKMIVMFIMSAIPVTMNYLQNISMMSEFITPLWVRSKFLKFTGVVLGINFLPCFWKKIPPWKQILDLLKFALGKITLH